MTTKEPITSHLREQLKKSLPKAGHSRWWEVKHNPKSRAKPITLRLMESYKPGSSALSSVIGFEYTIANVKALVETADLILVRAGDFDQLVGSYQLEP
jgi:hypothetical protein